MNAAWRAVWLAMSLAATPALAAAPDSTYAAIPASRLRTVLPTPAADATVAVPAFKLRRLPVTNGEFLRFVREHPAWRRGAVPGTLADEHYLQSWSGPTELGAQADERQPVTQVSWFAARAYCQSQHARLPSWNEWELVAAADARHADARADPRWRELILGWYSQPSVGALPPVGRTAANYYGVSDLHGLIWEWVEDFNALYIDADNRVQGDPDKLKFCGEGALSVQDRENYPTLMRLALLSSLQARSTTANLGFRCAYDPAPPRGPGIVLETTAGRQRFDQPGPPVRLVSMFYASCPMACPLTIDTIKAIERRLTPAQTAALKVLLVSFDTQRDSLARLRSLARERRLDLTRWTLARASAGDVRHVAAMLDIPYRRLDDGGFNHASRLVLLGSQGEIIARSDRFGVPDPAFIAAVQRALSSMPSK